MNPPAATHPGLSSAPSGICFLANDHVLNWSIAFFESLRAHNPDMPLVMIPFDDQIEKISALSGRYHFSIFDHPSLKELDRIGAMFYPDKAVPRKTFRKFASFWSPLERFIFSDVDIVLLDNVAEFADAYARSGMDLLHADTEIHQVYWGAEFIKKMQETYGARGFNTGFWASRRGLFDLNEIGRIAEDAMAVREGLNPGTYEQPFLNYCCDVKRVRYGPFADFMPELTRKFLAKQPGVRRTGQEWRIHDSTSPENGRRIKFLHWAGTPANEVMPYRSIFMHYRMRSEPLGTRVMAKLRSIPRAVVWNVIHWSRRTKVVSQAYKQIMPTRLQVKFGAVVNKK